MSRLKGSESRFRQLIRHSADAHYLYDEHGKVLQVNNRSCKEVGYSREELLQLSLFDISNTKSQQIEEILSSFKLGEVRTIDGEHIHKNGSVIPVEVSISYFMLDDKPVFSTFSRNISQRKIQEKQLKESETRLKQSEEIAHFGSWALNISNQKLIWSDEVFNIMGIDPSTKLNYEVFLNTIHPEDRERVNTTYLESVKEGYMYIVDYRIIMANGQLKYVHEQGRTDYDETGQPLRSYGYVQDITLQKNQELKLVELQRRADFANKTKSEFLANMSHELRTPMHGILSFASIGMKKYESATREKLQQYFSNIQVSGERLLLLLNNLLDLSKLEAGKMILNKKLTNLNKVFDSCYQEQEQRMKDLDLTLK
ncbi:MAG: PAS domain S-box protein, partial [Candidatus Heimdallarchaeota archaeon]|nr:PAS domain S-box protein [Candidatus Heimdallarchaeota archaeon]